ncbi:MAG: hypothetical protein RBT65_17965, partial [Methanolobus sp.]|nr:hypothetical protein [Methanolobus sp.]
MAQSFSNKIKEFQATLKNMPGTEKNAEALSRIIASVAASQTILRELGSRGMVSELKEYVDTIEKLMKSVSSIKIPKRPAMRSDSPKKNEQELLKYQRRLEKLNVVFDEYNKKVQKANEKAAMFASFTKHGYDKAEEIKDSKYTGDDELEEKNRQKLREFNELRRKEAERDYREAAAQVEREERQRQQEQARRFKALKTST